MDGSQVGFQLEAACGRGVPGGSSSRWVTCQSPQTHAQSLQNKVNNKPQDQGRARECSELSPGAAVTTVNHLVSDSCDLIASKEMNQ